MLDVRSHFFKHNAPNNKQTAGKSNNFFPLCPVYSPSRFVLHCINGGVILINFVLTILLPFDIVSCKLTAKGFQFRPAGIYKRETGRGQQLQQTTSLVILPHSQSYLSKWQTRLCKIAVCASSTMPTSWCSMQDL